MTNFLRLATVTISAGMLFGTAPTASREDIEYGFCPVRPHIRQSVPPSNPPLPASTLQHRLFLEERNGAILVKTTKEEIPNIEAHTALFQLTLRHPDNTIIFYEKENPDNILEIISENKTSPGWERVAGDIDRRRTHMINVAQEKEPEVSTRHRIPRNHISFRIGSQDRFNECLARSLPYFVAGKQILESHGLPWQAFFLGCPESDWRPELTSRALCVGTHQINEWNARHYGGIIPRTTKEQRSEAHIGKTIGWLLQQPDERRHPLLAINIAAQLLRKDAYSTGSVLGAINAYIAGPNNLDPVRAYVHQNEEYNERHNRDPFTWLSFTMSGGWKEIREAGRRDPAFQSQYGRFSSEYVARLLATVREIPPEYFEQATTHTLEAEIITIQYQGKNTLRVRDVAMFVGEEEYRKRNPHTPIGAFLPEGIRIELPPGSANAFFEQYSSRIKKDNYVRIERGNITTQDGSIPFLIAQPTNTAIDLQFSQIAERRRNGIYSQNDITILEGMISDLASACEETPTRFCQYQLDTLQMDLGLYRQESRKRLIRIIEAQEANRDKEFEGTR